MTYKTTLAALVFSMLAPLAQAEETAMLLEPKWEYVADRVMGGVSAGQIAATPTGTRLTGRVSLDNNGGFIQMAFDLAGGDTMDASAFTGVELTVRGNNEVYDLRLRTDELRRPWHSFRTEFTAVEEWQTWRIPFTAFEPHRTTVAFDPARLRRIGILAIGRVFDADIEVGAVAFY